MPQRNEASWNALVSGFVKVGLYGEAFKLFDQMRSCGFGSNGFVISSLITACSRSNDLISQAFQTHGFVVKSGLLDDVFIGTSLLHFYGTNGLVMEAKILYQGMPFKNIVSRTALMVVCSDNGQHQEVINMYKQMKQEGLEFNENTFTTVISSCGMLDNQMLGMQALGHVIKSGFESNLSVANSLVSMFDNFGDIDEASYVFDHMKERDTISWNSMISAYGHFKLCEKALGCLRWMRFAHNEVNAVTFSSLLLSCDSVDSVKWGRGIHGLALKYGIHSDVCVCNTLHHPRIRREGKIVHALAVSSGLANDLIVGNSLVTMYANCGLTMKAKQVFDMMPDQDTVTWNALIGGFAENDEADEAFETFKLMRRRGLQENYITIVNLLSSFSSSTSLLKHGLSIHALIISIGFETDEYVKNSLIIMYAKCSDLDSSSILFSKSRNITPVTYNAMISANARYGRGEDAMKMFKEMFNLGVSLDQFSFSSAFAAAAYLATLEEGKMLHGLAMKFGLDLNLHVLNAVMDMYGKCGELNDVLNILPEPVNRSRPSWNILISTYSRHGLFQLSRETFHEMLDAGIRADYVSFVSLLSACSHGGLVDEGLEYYSSMTRDFGISPGIEHCVCMVDLLGRVHGNVELSKRAAQQLIQMGPDDDSVYVLYSNVCASSGNWADVESIRNQMQLGNVKKKPACSWVKLKNKVTSFRMGDQTHPQAKKIDAKLEEMKKLITEAGYVPDTSFALHDTDEEQKEHNLWNHSERLALAYGLIISRKMSSDLENAKSGEVNKNADADVDVTSVSEVQATWRSMLLQQESVYGVAAGYCLSASLLSIINKWAIMKFPYPGALTALQYFTSAAVPIFVAIGETLFLHQPWPSLKTWASLATIFGGSVIYVMTDYRFTVMAYSWALAYLISMSIDFVYIKHVVMTIGLNTWSLVLYNNLEALLLFPLELFIMGELKKIEHDISDDSDWYSFCVILPVGLSYLFGLLISFFGFSYRKAISATGFTVLGIVNKLLTVVINLIIWDKHSTYVGDNRSSYLYAGWCSVSAIYKQ
ncbi:hypothetical protein RDABS01_000355 [Bienertia sinuspersici]